ncbi:MAG: peptidylprolyl isomerase [Vicinamibacterales bacterium]
MRRLLPLLVIGLTFVACSKASTSASVNASTPGTAAAGDAAQEAVKPVPTELPEVIARVNGENITRTQFEQAVQTVERQNGASVPPDQRDRVYRGVLEQLISFRLLIQETKARNLTVADAEVDARMAQIKGQFPSEEAFTQTLAQQKMTPEQLKADARSEMLVTKMLQTEVEPKVAISPVQVQEFYSNNPDRFKQGERVRASHILLRVPEQADQAAKNAVKTKAADVLKQVRAGQDFAALAKQFSEDPASATNGGDLNYFQKGQMVGPFDQAVFAMKVGDVSDLVETQFGFHIIKLTDKQVERAIPLTEVRAQVQQYLENQARQEQTQALIKALTAKGKVEILI